MSRQRLRPEHLWLLIGAGLLLLALASAGSYVLAKHRWAGSLVEQLEPRHARLAGLRTDGERLQATDQTLAANLKRVAYGAEGDPAQDGNTVLQQLRDASARRGLRLSSSQVLPAREEGDFQHIGIQMRVEGDMPALRDFLRDLAAHTPTIFSDSVQFSRQSRRADEQDVTVQLSLFILKVRP